MYLIYNKSTLKVISLFNNNVSGSDDTVLKQMFPNNFQDLYLWKIEKNINYVPVFLTVTLDENKDPKTLLYKGKEVYRSVVAPLSKQRIKNNDNLMTSRGIVIGKELSEFLISSPYTKKKTANDLINGLVPYQYPVPVVWRGFFKLSTGYSAIGRNILFRLHNYGILGKPEHLPSHSDIDPIYTSYLAKYDKLRFSRYCKNQVKVLSHTPLPDDFRGKKIIFTMMETETLHHDFVNMCNRYNEVWVPCRHNYHLFVNHGVKVPVHVVPLGVDERFYFGNNDKKINVEEGLLPLLGSGLKKFKFISLFQWYARKCPDILIKSFVKAFSDKDDVCLIVVNHCGEPSNIFNEVQSYAKSIRPSNWPSVFLYNQIPSDEQLPSVYKFCNAFVSTSMGEGFSLPHIEAAACGLPVISAHHTAMKDYLNNDNSYLVNVSRREICPSGLASACGWYSGQLFNILGDEEIESFSKNMKNVVENYDVALKKSQKLQNMVKNNYTWDITTGLAARRIRESF